MAFYKWSTSYTSITKSFNYFLGRQSVDSAVNTTALTATLFNNTESTFPVAMNSNFGVNFNIGATTYAQIAGKAFSFDYNDEPNTGTNSTVTVAFMNAIGINSLRQLTNQSISAGTTQDQIASINALGSPLFNYLPGTGTSTYNMAAQTYTGSPSDYVRTLANAENAMLVCRNSFQAEYNSYAAGFIVSPCSIGRTLTSTQLGYQSIRRIRFQSPFYNKVTVTPSTGLTAQTETNTASVTAYGEKAYNLNTFYSTEAQADSAASWYANAFANDGFRFEVDFLVDAQSAAMFTKTASTTTAGTVDTSPFAGIVFGNYPSLINVAYRAPGAVSDTIVPCINEGIQVNATPESTFCTMYLTPAIVYSQFILNSTYFGVLDTDRLGW
jgi:hypothetical protein